MLFQKNIFSYTFWKINIFDRIFLFSDKYFQMKQNRFWNNAFDYQPIRRHPHIQTDTKCWDLQELLIPSSFPTLRRTLSTAADLAANNSVTHHVIHTRIVIHVTYKEIHTHARISRNSGSEIINDCLWSLCAVLYPVWTRGGQINAADPVFFLFCFVRRLEKWSTFFVCWIYKISGDFIDHFRILSMLSWVK